MLKNLKFNCILVLGTFIISTFLIGGLTMTVNASTASTNNNNAMTVIDFSTGTQTTNTLQQMVDHFNTLNATYGFTVRLDSNAFETQSQLATYTADFNAKSTALDVISMDIIWPQTFAPSGWLVPLDSVFNTSYQAQFLQASIEAGTYQGHIYGVPWFHDSGMLYYRTDILSYANTQGIINDPNGASPVTWPQLNNWTVAMLHNTTLVNKFNLTAGFVWQGKSYEGLMCDYMEYLGGTGTYSWLNSADTASTFNSSYGTKAALQEMKYLITSGASPAAVLNYDEEGSRAVWNAGSAIFMRNWSYAYPLSLQSTALNGIADGTGVQQFNVTVMPKENATVTNALTSCLGGWQLGVSAYSTHKADAEKFVLWITAAAQQTTYFLGAGDTPTIAALYNSSVIMNSPQGYVHYMYPAYARALPRPQSPDYTQMSDLITVALNEYLGNSSETVNTALTTMQNDVSYVLANYPVTTATIPINPQTTITTIIGTTLPGSNFSTNSPNETATITVSTPGWEMFSVLSIVVLSLEAVLKRRKFKS